MLAARGVRWPGCSFRVASITHGILAEHVQAGALPGGEQRHRCMPHLHPLLLLLQAALLLDDDARQLLVDSVLVNDLLLQVREVCVQ